jgi:hypothetical protein
MRTIGSWNESWKIKNEMIEQKMEYLQKYLEDFDNRIIQTLVSVGDIYAYHCKKVAQSKSFAQKVKF